MKWFVLVLCCAAATLSAQTPVVETFFVVQNNDSIPVKGIVSPDNDALGSISLDPAKFPTVTIPRNIFLKTLDIGNRNNRLGAALQLENQLLRERDTINSRQIAVLNSVVSLRDQQIQTCEQTNQMLNQNITTLSGQVETSLELAKEARKGNFGKKAWGMLLGGGIGLGLGVVLGVIAAK